MASAGACAACVDPEDLAAFVAGALRPEEVRGLEAHVARCSACRRLLSAAVAGATSVEISGPGPRDAGSASPTIPFTAWGEEVEIELGARVGRYIVLERLGAGGMGVVYAAHDPELDRKVALKLIRGDAVVPEQRERLRDGLRQEAQSMARLAHPNVVTVYDIGSCDGHIYIAMELVDGVTLGHWLTAAPRRWRETIAMFRHAGSGLAAAHAAGLVHCDFKPENVLIGSDGRARVSDFGLASMAVTWDALAPTAGSAGDVHRPSGTRRGTLLYMAPEQHRGGALDHRTDQFSFCVALWGALTREHCFEAARRADTAGTGIAGRLAAARRHDAMPAHVRRALERGLATEPGDRYPSMDALLTALARDPARRRTRVAVAAALAVVIVGGGAAAYRLGSMAGPRPCKDAQRSWSGIWDAARAERLAAVFAATGKPYAAAMFTRVKRTLDAYSADWVKIHTEACEATHVSGDQPEELLQKRMLCLDARLRDASALIARFETSPGLVDRAPDALSMLGDLSACSDLQGLASQIPPPATPTQRAQVEQVQARLAQVKSAVLASDRSARAQAEAVAVAASATHYRALEAEALDQLAIAQTEGGDLAAGRATLEKAIWAAEAGRADRLAAQCWLRLMIYTSYVESASVVLALASRVTALLERMGGDGAIEGRLHAIVASELLVKDDIANARVEAKTALALLEKHDGPDDPRVASATDVLSQIAYYEGHIALSVQLRERSYAIRRLAYGDDNPYLASTMCSLAESLIAARRFPEAIGILDKAVALLQPAVAPDHRNMLTCGLHLGQAYYQGGEVAKAVPLLERTSRLGKTTFGSQHPQYANLLSAYGASLAAAGRHAEAVPVLHQALAIYSSANGPDDTAALDALRDLAESERALKRYTDARAHAAHAVAILEKVYGPETPNLVDILRVLGSTEIAAGNSVHAVAVLERACRLLGPDSTTLTRAATQFQLARALWSTATTNPAQRSRARSLAQAARELLAGDPGQRGQLTEIDGWLASTGGERRSP